MTSLTAIKTEHAVIELPAGSVMENILSAVVEYRARKDRKIHPGGTFDSAGRFFIAEGCSCCEDIARPTRSHPYGQMNHGRTLGHVAHLHRVEDYLPIVKKAKSIYENSGTEACKEYLLTNKVRDSIFSTDLGL